MRGEAMIRQAISCDICGAEKRQTNHWFVAYTHGGELRINAWNAQKKLRAGSKHLCGQTCLNKLLDEFVARTMANRAQPLIAEPLETVPPAMVADTSLTSKAFYAGITPTGRMPVPQEIAARETPPVSAAVIAISPARTVQESRPLTPVPPVDSPSVYSSRHWRAEAWERERERERRSGLTVHRKTL